MGGTPAQTMVARVALACAAALALAPGRAAADQFDTLNVVFGGNVLHDSNLFRISDAVDPQTRLGPGNTDKSDVITSRYAGLRIDKPWSQQRFQFDLTKTETRYKNFRFLNSNSLDYRAAWLWKLGARFSGTLSTDRRESQVPFSDVQVFQRNLRITQNHVFSLDGALFGGWHALLGASRLRQTTDAPTLAEADFELNRGEAGVKYLAAPGNSVAVVQRFGRGVYANRVLSANSEDNEFREEESEILVNWVLSGRSSVIGRLTAIERTHPHFSERDFSALGGELRYAWAPTAKLSLDLSARRGIAPYFTVSSTYRVDKALALGSSWQVAARTGLRLQLARIYSDFPGSLASGPERKDRFDTAELTADWAATRWLSLGASLQHQRRKSSIADVEFDATIARVSASLLF